LNKKKIAIIQSSYIPWKGYFDIINSVDEFIIYDDIEYSHGTWRNRNRISTSAGVQWMTIPVNIHGKSRQKINQVTINRTDWSKKHWKTLVQNYSKASFFAEYKDLFEELYLGCREKRLSRINYRFIKALNGLLGIPTVVRWSDEYKAEGERNDRLVSLCKESNASTYLSGPAAKVYLDRELFRQEGIGIEWVDYSGYAQYSQLHQPFEHGVTILDLIFNMGGDAAKYMKSFGDKQ
jgi:hypothetical protein